MLGSERKLYIMDQLERIGVIKLKSVCDALNASESTIRRDFEELEQQGQLKRVHGGAVKISLGTTLTDRKELSMQQKSEINVEEKRCLCRQASSLVADGDCIFVDGGTTLMFLSEFLEGKRIKLVTHNNFMEVKEGSTIELIRVGGKYLPNYNMNVGSIALQTLSLFNFDYAFIGCAGIDVNEEIAYTAEMDSAQVKTLAMKQSLHSYLLVDQSKFETRGFYKFCDIREFDGVFMDAYPKHRKKPSYITLCNKNDFE